MRFLLISASNESISPYIRIYEKILIENGIRYDNCVWDRIGQKSDAKFIFTQRKKGIRRNLFDYLSYRRYIKENVNFLEYTHVIVFTLQLGVIVKGIIPINIVKYLDIRDFNRIVNIPKIDKYILEYDKVFVSSPEFKIWLPQNQHRYILSHNSEDYIKTSPLKFRKSEVIKIGVIGSISYYRANLELVEKIAQTKDIELFYHGDGIAKDPLERFSKKNGFENIIFTGYYDKSVEREKYDSVDWVFVPLSNDINSKTMLPNRLYNALRYGKPLITNGDNYFSNIVKKYNLGVVVEDIYDIDKNLLLEFDTNKYNDGAIRLAQKINEDIKIFKTQLFKSKEKEYYET